MKRNFVVGMFGGLIGSAMLLLVLSAAGIVGARSADVTRSDVSRANEVSAATPLTSTFTYQGQLKNGGTAVNGSCQMAFRLYDDPSASTNLIGSPITTTVPMTNGLFTVGLNFGSNAFNGNGRWLDIQVNCGSGFVPLPRQAVTAAPYSLFALSTGALQSYPITTTAPTTGQVLKWNGSAWIPDIDNTGGGSFWSLTGNSGTNPNTNFMGTSDNVSLTLRVSNTAALRIMPNATSPNIAGGYSGNVISSTVVGAVIGGGGASCCPNRVQDNYATIGGGFYNTAGGPGATVGGGYGNTASGKGAFVGGGGFGGGWVGSNQATGGASTIGGGVGNTASGVWSTVGGGIYNIASGAGAFVGGGGTNGSSIGSNQAVGNASTIGGGGFNTVTGTDATVGGGWGNTANDIAATVGGGVSNQANGSDATVGGGYNNIASGYASTIPGGENNTASMTYTFAAGYHAQALHQGAFVWADSTGADFASTANDQFLVRASGGARFYGGNNWNLSGTEGDWRVGNDTYRLKIGVATGGGGAGDVYIRAQGGTSRILFSTPGGMIIYSNITSTAGVQLAPGGGSWSSLSDRNVKANFTAVDGRDVLARLATIPIQTWNYQSQDVTIRHIGPMAQDFYAAFNVGEDDKHITTIDSEGVALAAIQGLYQTLQDKDAQIAQLQTRLSSLEQNQQPSSFNGFNLLSLIAFAGFAIMWLQQRRSKRGEA
jgi:trimeric autotransporter adhesin